MGLIYAIVAVLAMVGLDQWAKSMTVTHLMNQPDINLIDGVFELAYVENRGAAFGMLQNKVWLFAIFTIIVLAGMVLLYVRLPKVKRYRPLKITLVLLFSGAVGNFVDRISIGYVVDMFHFYWFEFPVFNVADIFIVISCIALVLLMLFYYKEEELDLWAIIRGKYE